MMKKLMSLFLVFVFTVESALVVFADAKPVEPRPVDYGYQNKPTEYGFWVDKDLYDLCGYCSKELVNEVYLNNMYHIGDTRTKLIFTRSKKKVNNKWKNVAMYETKVEPLEFGAFAKNDRYLSYQAKSEMLRITTELDRDCQTLIETLPASNKDFTSYDIEFKKSTKMPNIFASVSEIKKGRLKINNKSDLKKKKYCVEYDYKRASDPTASSNSYLKKKTKQRGMIAYYTDGVPFSFKVQIYSSFGYFIGTQCYDNQASIDCVTPIRIK